MARKAMVTRTIQTTVCTVLCLNVETAEPFNETVTLPRTYKDDASMMKRVEKMLNTDTVRAVHIVSSKVESALYGMEESKFIELAELLPPRDASASENETCDNAE